MHDPSAVTTFLFSDIEGSTRLWEQDTDRMRPALARHDALVRAAVEGNKGNIVKMTGDGMFAAFGDPVDALGAALAMQLALADPTSTDGVALHVRCGLHVGVVEHRDDDYFGRVLNRASRIMGAAYGGQVLLSEAVAVLLGDRLPPGVTLRDLGSLRLRDLGSAEHVHQVVHPRLRSDFPALRTLEAVPNNLPSQMTSFVGRERELAEVEALLAKTRLLTLVGVGGLGKTRLSLHVAADTMDDYPDGVWFVELAPLADDELVPQAVAYVLGVKEDTGRPVIEALARHVKDKRMLLVLDNCEHLLRGCAEFARQLLRSGAHVRILASSREPLHLTGETIYPVPSLAIPDRQQDLAPADLTQFEAVHLFLDRAVAAQPAFRLTDQNAGAVVDVCRRLDGIPLALELAAARVRALSVETIADRLSDRFRLLTSGDRTALPRQQTLRASIDWSYDLLTESERALLRRLAVFAGGWTLEAVEAVGAGGAINAADVLDLTSHLVDKSLVAREARGERYHLPETVRSYAQERLVESGEETQTRACHLAFFVELAERARPQLVGPDQATWLSRLDLERENLLSAHAWAEHASSDGTHGLRLVCSLKHYWINRGLLGLGHRVTVEALARSGAQERTFARSWALSDAGQLSGLMGRYVEAKGYLEESLEIAREIRDKRRILVVLQPLGIAHHGQGDLAMARRYFDEALTLARELGDRREVAAALNALAQISREEGALDTAEPLYESVLALARELQDREITAVGLLNLAMVSIGRGNGGRTRAMLVEVLGIVMEIGSKPLGQSALEVSAGLAAFRGDWARAARFFGAAEAQTIETGLQRDPADEAFLAPLITSARSAVGAEQFDASQAAGRVLPHEAAMAEVLAWLEQLPDR